MKKRINIDTRKLYPLDSIQHLNYCIEQAIRFYAYTYTEINFTFYIDDELLELNKIYLNHDFYTDIITFDNTISKTISADIAISIERVKENAKKQNVSIATELCRVMIHGILHCIGYSDKTEDEQLIMRQEEDKMLNMFHVEHLNLNNHV